MIGFGLTSDLLKKWCESKIIFHVFLFRFECFSIQALTSSAAVSMIYGIPRTIHFKWYIIGCGLWVYSYRFTQMWYSQGIPTRDSFPFFLYKTCSHDTLVCGTIYDRLAKYMHILTPSTELECSIIKMILWFIRIFGKL